MRVSRAIGLRRTETANASRAESLAGATGPRWPASPEPSFRCNAATTGRARPTAFYRWAARADGRTVAIGTASRWRSAMSSSSSSARLRDWQVSEESRVEMSASMPGKLRAAELNRQAFRVFSKHKHSITSIVCSLLPSVLEFLRAASIDEATRPSQNCSFILIALYEARPFSKLFALASRVHWWEIPARFCGKLRSNG